MKRFKEGRIELCLLNEAIPPEGVAELMRLPEALEHLPGAASRSAGLRTIWRWKPPWLGGKGLVVRQFVHGGLLGRLWGTAFLGSRAMENELRVAARALEAGVPTCRPLALRLERAWGPLLRAHYVTEEIPDTLNLLEVSRRVLEGGNVPPPARFELAGAVAAAIAAMHRAGIEHRDLNLKNVLVTPRAHPPAAFVVDFKKARLRARVSLERGLKGLARLDRSVLKWPASRRAVTLSDRLRTLRAYARAVEGEGCDWKRLARALRTGR